MHTHFGTDLCMLSRCLLTKFLHRSSTRKSTKVALLVGLPHRVGISNTLKRGRDGGVRRTYLLLLIAPHARTLSQSRPHFLAFPPPPPASPVFLNCHFPPPLPPLHNHPHSSGAKKKVRVQVQTLRQREGGRGRSVGEMRKKKNCDTPFFASPPVRQKKVRKKSVFMG